MRRASLASFLFLCACSTAEDDPLGDTGVFADSGWATDSGDLLLDAGAPLDASPIGDASPPDDAGTPEDGGVPTDGGSLPDSCITSAAAGRARFSCGDLTFELSVPASCVAGGCGLIVDLHGFSMSGVMQDNNTGLAALGEQHGYVVIQPTATGRPYFTAWRVQDDATVLDFVERAERVFAIDPKRIHATGFSQGGFMTWRFICAHADYFASAAPAAAASDCPVAANLPGSSGVMFPACHFISGEAPSVPIPVLYMHGRMDSNYVPFSCAAPQVDAVRAHWNLTEATDVASSTEYTRTRYTDPAGPALLEAIFHDYSSSEDVTFVSGSELQGHCYPGSTDPGGESGQFFSFACQQSTAFAWGEEVIAFFMAHPKP